MQITDKAKEKLDYLKEWTAWYAPLIALFVFFYSQTSAMNHRIDATIQSTNQRIDETIRIGHERADQCNARADQLHQEFTDLLKEMRKQN
jgi:uncharacterized coiled-coil DUF342 family protein